MNNVDTGDTSQFNKNGTGLSLVIEHLTQEAADGLVADHSARKEKSSLLQLLLAIENALRQEDLLKTRLVITGDMVATVNAREDRSNKEFTIERGSGVVVAKTMPPNNDGIVDILMPIYWVLPLENSPHERDDYIQHVAAHEAVHASLFHIGDEPFDLHHREEFGYAMQNFLIMASEQAEEHLAEFIGSKVTGRQIEQTAAQVSSSIEAWQDAISIKLPAIPEDSPDYYQRGMIVTFESLHILWKSLAYLAAALRIENQFNATPPEIMALPSWKKYIDPWWSKYLELLGRIPMTVDVDIKDTDEVIRELALHLQRWANEIGFDFHDTKQGAFFRIKSDI